MDLQQVCVFDVYIEFIYIFISTQTAVHIIQFSPTFPVYIKKNACFIYEALQESLLSYHKFNKKKAFRQMIG